MRQLLQFMVTIFHDGKLFIYLFISRGNVDQHRSVLQVWTQTIAGGKKQGIIQVLIKVLKEKFRFYMHLIPKYCASICIQVLSNVPILFSLYCTDYGFFLDWKFNTLFRFSLQMGNWPCWWF